MTEKQIQLAGYLTKGAPDLTEGRLSFIASIEQPDREGDVFRSAGMKANLANVPLLKDHHPGEPVGQVLALDAVSRGGVNMLLGEAQLVPAGTSPYGDIVRNEIAAGVRQGFSLGFLVRDAERRKEGGLVFHKTELVEISTICTPAVEGALLTAMKAMGAAEEPTIEIEGVSTFAELKAYLDEQFDQRQITEEYVRRQVDKELERILPDLLVEALRRGFAEARGLVLPRR